MRIGDVGWPPGVMRSEVRGRCVCACELICLKANRLLLVSVPLYDV